MARDETTEAPEGRGRDEGLHAREPEAASREEAACVREPVPGEGAPAPDGDGPCADPCAGALREQQLPEEAASGEEGLPGEPPSGEESLPGEPEPGEDGSREALGQEAALQEAAPCEGKHSKAAAPAKARRRPLPAQVRVVLYALATLAAIFVLSACVLGASALHAYGAAKGIASEAGTLCSKVLQGDKAGAQDAAADVAGRVRDLDGELSGPVWSLATVLPVVGGDVSRVQELLDASADLCDNALVPYVQALPEDTPVKIVREDKSIDAYALQTLVRPLGVTATTFKRVSDEVQQMDDAVLPPVDKAVRAAKTALSLLAGISQNAGTTADKLPDMLGEEGERAYLLMAQQNAEARSTGGFWGSAGLLYLRQGKIELGDFSTGAHFSDYLSADRALPETEEEKVLFGERICRVPADSNFIPDFPTAVSRYREMWLRCGQPDVQGAVALDPVFLQQVLALTGGVTTSNGTLVDGTNAARILEHDVYYDLPVKQQDAFFSEVAKLAFAKLMSSDTHIDALDALLALGRAFDNRRLQLWMADDDEESVLLSLGCAGEVSQDVANPTLGVYFNNTSYSKLSWWLKADTQVTATTENADGSTSYQVTTTMTNTMTAEEESSLPKYVAASNSTGVCPTAGSMALWTYVYAPAAGSIGDMSCAARFADPDDVAVEAWLAGEPGESMSCVRYDEHDVWFGVVLLSPGESAMLSYVVTTPSGNELSVDTTPLGQSEDT